MHSVYLIYKVWSDGTHRKESLDSHKAHQLFEVIETVSVGGLEAFHYSFMVSYFHFFAIISTLLLQLLIHLLFRRLYQ